MVIHRLLYRFFSKLRQNLLLPEARKFRKRYPKISKLFVSQLSPSIGSSLAGLALLIQPPSDRRATVSVYTFVKSLEYCYNRLEDIEWFRNRPWVCCLSHLDHIRNVLTKRPCSGLAHGYFSRLPQGNCCMPLCLTEIVSRPSTGDSLWGTRKNMSKKGRLDIQTISTGRGRTIL